MLTLHNDCGFQEMDSSLWIADEEIAGFEVNQKCIFLAGFRLRKDPSSSLLGNGPGDAEVESWKIMRQKRLLRPVDLLKVSHHGSINGMPFEGEESVVDLLLKPGRKTKAIVSTCRGVYGKTGDTEIPNPRLMALLEKRCNKDFIDTEKDVKLGGYKDIEL